MSDIKESNEYLEWWTNEQMLERHRMFVSEEEKKSVQLLKYLRTACGKSGHDWGAMQHGWIKTGETTQRQIFSDGDYDPIYDDVEVKSDERECSVCGLFQSRRSSTEYKWY